MEETEVTKTVEKGKPVIKPATIVIIVLAIALVASLLWNILGSIGSSRSEPRMLVTDKHELSYAIGMQVGRSLEQYSDDLDSDYLLMGIRHLLEGVEPMMNDKEAAAVQQKFFSKLRQKQDAQRQASSKINRSAGLKFLEQNKTKPGVLTTPSGLQYQVLTQGKGPKPVPADTVTVHYKGTLIDGTEFDSSYSRKQPATFRLDRVIPGWTEGLQLMPVGSKYKLFIPSELAYGKRGSGQKIGPDSVLVFEVELLKIEKDKK